MNTHPIALISLLCTVCAALSARAQDMDKELANLAEKLAASIKENGSKKVTVIDFTDLEGAVTELGKYISEQLTVDLVLEKRDYSVLDRANLRKILAEHKLTASGLVDPENAKKLGMFAGVDVLVLGTIIPKTQSVSLNAKLITTETAEILGAARAEFKKDDAVHHLLSRPASDTKENPISEKSEDPGVVKSFGDARVELQPLRILSGNEFLLTMTVTNRNSKSSIWVALNTGSDFPPGLKAVVTDSGGIEFLPEMNSISGIAFSSFQSPYISRATEVKPGEFISASVKFLSRTGKKAMPGSCRLQLELLLGNDFDGNQGTARLQNLITKIAAK